MINYSDCENCKKDECKTGCIIIKEQRFITTTFIENKPKPETIKQIVDKHWHNFEHQLACKTCKKKLELINELEEKFTIKQ